MISKTKTCIARLYLARRHIRERREPRSGNSTSAGFTFIELLVSLLVLGVGVLGVTGLQMVSLQNNRAALSRAEAVQLANDMFDRIRANATGAPLGAAYDGVSLEDDPPTFVNCLTNACTPNQMRNFDVTVWKCALGGFHEEAACEAARAADALPEVARQPGLPEGDGSIDMAANGMITVTVRWVPNDGGAPMEVAISSQG